MFSSLIETRLEVLSKMFGKSVALLNSLAFESILLRKCFLLHTESINFLEKCPPFVEISSEYTPNYLHISGAQGVPFSLLKN